MTENATNRRWLVNNQMTNRGTATQRDRDAETLLYYKSQLEAELTHVMRQLVALGAITPGS